MENIWQEQTEGDITIAIVTAIAANAAATVAIDAVTTALAVNKKNCLKFGL